MVKVKGRKGRPSLGTHMERQSQRGRWKESSNLERNNRFFLNFLVLFDFALDILGYSSGVDSLVNSIITSAQKVRL